MNSLNFSGFMVILMLLGILNCSSKSIDKEKEKEVIFQEFSASFKLMGDGYDETIYYNSKDNLIFCRIEGDNLWIRFARDKSDNGNNSPHIDIDICNYAGAGVYAPVDPKKRPCPLGLFWDIFWHDDERVYANQGSSSPCQLTLNLSGDILSGIFNCRDVVRFQGTETIEITEGTFTCKIERNP